MLYFSLFLIKGYTFKILTEANVYDRYVLLYVKKMRCVKENIFTRWATVNHVSDPHLYFFSFFILHMLLSLFLAIYFLLRRKHLMAGKKVVFTTPVSSKCMKQSRRDFSAKMVCFISEEKA